jgi:hypothetical protein
VLVVVEYDSPLLETESPGAPGSPREPETVPSELKDSELPPAVTVNPPFPMLTLDCP